MQAGDPELSRALQKAGRLLARRAHSRAEIEARLRGAGFDDGVVARAVERLAEHCLVDDVEMATAWVAERRVRRSPAALAAELGDKGIAGDVIERAVGELDEYADARAAALRLHRKVAGRPLAKQGASLFGMLVRRGYAAEAAEAAVRSVLPPQGWD
jgi:regulatory protein